MNAQSWFTPPGKQPELLQEEADLLPVPDLVPLQLTVGDLFGWLRVGIT